MEVKHCKASEVLASLFGNDEETLVDLYPTNNFRK